MESGQQDGPALDGHDGAVTSIAFSPDAQTLASAGEDGAVVMWDVAEHRPRRELVGEAGEPVNSVVFSPDGETLATGADRVNLWDVASGARLGSLQSGTRDFVAVVAFSPDGQTLAWGSYSIAPTDHLLVLWPATIDAWKRDACALANRNLSQDEWSRYVAPTRDYLPTCT
jgi:WD40 repeat protein